MRTFSYASLLLFVFLISPLPGTTSTDKGQGLDVELRLDSPIVPQNDTSGTSMVIAWKVRATQTLESMTNLFAEQDLQTWQEGKNKKNSKYEIIITNGKQFFKKINNAGKRGKLITDLPAPNKSVVPGSEWYDLIKDIFDVSLTYRGVSTYQGKPVHIYAYSVKSQEHKKLCFWKDSLDSKIYEMYTNCSGEIISDQMFNSIAISRSRCPTPSHLTVCVKEVVAYDFVDIPGKGKITLPLSIKMAAEFEDGTWYYAYVDWKNYGSFSSISYFTAEEKIIYNLPPSNF